MLFFTLGPSSLPVVVAQPDERHANRTASVLVAQPDERHANRTASVLEWYDRHRA